MTNQLSRRTALAAIGTAGALAAIPVAVAASHPVAGKAPDEGEDRYQIGLRKGEDIALLYMARAWMDG